MNWKEIKGVIQNTWKKSVFIALIWLLIQYTLALVILLETVLKTGDSQYLVTFSQFVLLLLAAMFPITVGHLATNFPPYEKEKKYKRYKIGAIAGAIFGTTIGIFSSIFSTILFLLASTLVGIFISQSQAISNQAITSIFGLYIFSISVFLSLPLTIIFGAFYGVIGSTQRKISQFISKKK